MRDASELADWFDAHAGALVLYARQWLSDRAAAEDVVQEVFVRLLSARHSHPSNVRAWLFAAVRNAAIDAARSESRRKRRERRKLPAAWFEKRPDDLLDAESVQHAVAQLPPRQREVVTLRVWSEMTLTEISQVMGIAISTVHDEYRRGLDAMRKLMEATCSTNPRMPN